MATIESYWLTTLDVFFVILIWYTVNIIEWLLHMLSHSRINLPLFKQLHDVHMNHHRVHYPVSNLLKAPPYQDGSGMTVFGPLFIFLALGAFYVLPYRYAWIFDVEALIILSISTYMHDAFHIKGHYLEKYNWFLKRRALHFYHHGHLKNNMSLSGIDNTMDKCMKTYVQVQIPNRGSNKEGCVPDKKVD